MKIEHLWWTFYYSVLYNCMTWEYHSFLSFDISRDPFLQSPLSESKWLSVLLLNYNSSKQENKSRMATGAFFFAGWLCCCGVRWSRGVSCYYWIKSREWWTWCCCCSWNCCVCNHRRWIFLQPSVSFLKNPNWASLKTLITAIPCTWIPKTFFSILATLFRIMVS